MQADYPHGDKADKPEDEYIKNVSFNGKALDKMFITYEELLQGGELKFQ